MTLVAFDSSFLIAMAEPKIAFGSTAGGLTEDEARTRFMFLLREMEKNRTRILLPTPVLAEVLVKRPENVTRLLQALQRSSRFQIGEFGQAAAAETAEMFRRQWPQQKRRLQSLSKHGLKFDLQILAIAKVAGCRELFTTDHGLAALARLEKIKATGVVELTEAKLAQPDLPLEQAKPDGTGVSASPSGGSPPSA